MQKQSSVVRFGSLAVFVAALLLASPLGTLAAKPELTNITPAPVTVTSPNDNSQAPKLVNENAISKKGGSVSALSTGPIIAILTVFADPTQFQGNSGSGGIANFGKHAWITVKNTSSSNINVGAFSGIAPGATMSIGTYGNTPEDTGLWYNLDAYKVYYGEYSGRISVSYGLNATELNNLNSFIRGSDYWSAARNCSYFAAQAWDTITVGKKLGAFMPTYTPANLAASMKLQYPSYWTPRAAVPWYYAVYWVNSAGTPIRSTVFK